MQDFESRRLARQQQIQEEATARQVRNSDSSKKMSQVLAQDREKRLREQQRVLRLNQENQQSLDIVKAAAARLALGLSGIWGQGSDFLPSRGFSFIRRSPNLKLIDGRYTVISGYDRIEDTARHVPVEVKLALSRTGELQVAQPEIKHLEHKKDRQWSTVLHPHDLTPMSVIRLPNETSEQYETFERSLKYTAFEKEERLGRVIDYAADRVIYFAAKYDVALTGVN